MDFSSNEPASIFDHYVDRRFQARSFWLLIRCYERAVRHCGKYAREVAHDHFPYHRRTLFEDRWLKLAKAEGIPAASENNYAHNCHHTTIRIGSIVMIAQAVENPGDPVRRAIFRNTLAESNQRLLFENQRIKPVADSPLLALLLHGPTTSKVPYFADIMFPLPDLPGLNAYHEERISLFARFPKLVQRIETPKEETILDSIEPQIRTDIPKTGDDV
jgi:hypothetical protein